MENSITVVEIIRIVGSPKLIIINSLIMKKNTAKTYITILFFMFTLCYCQTKSKKIQPTEFKNQENPTIKIDINRNAVVVDEITLSSIADSVEYIPLDILNNVLISKIQGLEVTDSFILIRDKGSTYLFDLSGQFKKSLYNVGRGPGEAYGTHLAVDRKRGDIYVGNRWTMKVMRYSADGEFIEEKSYKHFLYQFYYLNNLLIFPGHFSPKDYSFYVQYFGHDSVCYKHPFRYNHLPTSRGGYSNMYIWFDIYNGRVFFKEQVCDTIFSTTVFRNIKAAYILDFGHRSLKPEDYFSKSPNKFDNKNFITAFKERGDFLIMKGVDDNKLCQYIYDKKNEKITKAFDLKLTNDIDGGPLLHFWEMSFSSYDMNTLYFFIEPYELLDKENKPLENSKLDIIRKGTSINNNPILVRAYLKR